MFTATGGLNNTNTVYYLGGPGVGTAIEAGTVAAGNSTAFGANAVELAGTLRGEGSSPVILPNAITLGGVNAIGGFTPLVLNLATTESNSTATPVTDTGGVTINSNITFTVFGLTLGLTNNYNATVTLNGNLDDTSIDNGSKSAPITGISETGTAVTVTATNGYVAGQQVTIAGVATAAYDGNYTIVMPCPPASPIPISVQGCQRSGPAAPRLSTASTASPKPDSVPSFSPAAARSPPLGLAPP